MEVRALLVLLLGERQIAWVVQRRFCGMQCSTTSGDDICCHPVSNSVRAVRSGHCWVNGHRAHCLNRARCLCCHHVYLQVPQECLQPLLRAMFLRFICLMTASDSDITHHAASAGSVSGSQASAAAVLAYRYGSVLLELLGSVLGCAAHLHQGFSVEVQHLMAVPQVTNTTTAVLLLD